MSEYQTPIGPIFEFQRETIKRGADLMQLPRTIREELSAEGLKTGQQAGKQLLKLSQESVQQSLSVTASFRSDGIDDLRKTVDTVFDDLRESHEQLYDTVERKYDETDLQAQTRNAEQLTVLLDLNRRLEHQLVEAVEEFEQQIAQSDEVATGITDRIDRLSEQLDRETERYSDLQRQLRENINPATPPAKTTTESVQCRVCGDSYNAITHSHLQTHGMTVEDYRTEFGADVPM